MSESKQALISRSFTAESDKSLESLSSDSDDAYILSQPSFSQYFSRSSQSESVALSATEVSQSSQQSSLTAAQSPRPSQKRRRSSDQDQELPERPSIEDPGEPEHAATQLCPRCLEYDLQKAVDVPLEAYLEAQDGITIANVGVRFRTLSVSTDCPLCRMFWSSRLQAKNRQDGEDELRAFPFLRYFSDIKDDHKSWRNYVDQNQLFFLAIVPSYFSWFRYVFGFEYRNHFGDNGYALCNNGPVGAAKSFAPRRVPPEFDPGLPSKWLKFCKTSHRKLCGQTSERDLASWLIDCHSLQIVSGRHRQPYVALSYVWGAKKTEDQVSRSESISEGEKLPSVVPTVITDAIAVTKALNMQYLWVDKYCIDQADHETKHDQIMQMDSIYANAELTIVAAAGDDEDFGLPGIGGKFRTPQTMVKVGNLNIVSTMIHPHKLINSSKWSTRGWTYQEAVLSRRRLVFTKEQVYYECNAMNCYESLFSSLDVLHTKDRSRFRGCMRAGIFGRKNTHLFGHFDIENLAKDGTFIRYLNHVESYAARDLGYDADSLNAFTGILKHFEIMKWPVLQIWGVPFLHPRTMEKSTTKDYDRYFTDALCWSHKHSCWDLENAPRRRPAIPSWSWAGWAGAIEYSYRDYYEAVTFVSEVQNICLEIRPGCLLDYRSAFANPSEEDKELHHSHKLSLMARAMPPTAYSLFHVTDSSRLKLFNWVPEFTFSSGPKSAEEALIGFKKEKLLCLFMGWRGSNNFFLIVEARGSCFSRMGLMTLKTDEEIESTPKRRFLIE